MSFRQPSDLEEDRTSMLKAGLFLAFFFVAVVTLANGNQVKNFLFHILKKKSYEKFTYRHGVCLISDLNS